MAITQSAKKAARRALRRRVFNQRRKRAVHDAVKTVITKASAEALQAAFKALDKAAKARTISKNAAARTKSRLAKALARAK